MTLLAVQASLVITNVSPAKWAFPIRSNGHRQTIGRAVAAEICIPAEYNFVSRHHAEVWSDQHGIWIHDVGSRLGTRVNGVRVERLPQASIAIGDRIWLGGLELNVVMFRPAPVKIAGDDKQHHALAALHAAETMLPFSLDAHARFERLTPAETEVVLWMCRGHTADEDIGHQLHRSPHTVRTQIGSILSKLELHSRNEILNWLKRQGISLDAVLPAVPSPEPPTKDDDDSDATWRQHSIQ